MYSMYIYRICLVYASMFIDCCRDACIKVWRMEGKQTVCCFSTFDEDKSPITGVAHFGGQSPMLVTCNEAGTVSSWMLVFGKNVVLKLVDLFFNFVICISR